MPLTDTALLEWITAYYYADSLEEGHEMLAEIVYDKVDLDEAVLYANCFPDSGEYVMPEQMKEFAMSLWSQGEDDFEDEDGYDVYLDEDE